MIFRVVLYLLALLVICMIFSCKRVDHDTVIIEQESPVLWCSVDRGTIYVDFNKPGWLNGSKIKKQWVEVYDAPLKFVLGKGTHTFTLETLQGDVLTCAVQVEKSYHD